MCGPATPAFPGRLYIAPNSGACMLAGIYVTHRAFAGLRRAAGLKECERFVGPVVAVLVVVVGVEGEDEAGASAVEEEVRREVPLWVFAGCRCNGADARVTCAISF